MAGFQNFAKIETWKVGELVDATSAKPRGKRKVTIPYFQRRLVWNKGKREALIDSIKIGYPIGTLLMYKEPDATDDKELYKLIDGLQRTQALKEYVNTPNRQFKKDELSDDFLEYIASVLNHYAEFDCLKREYKKKLKEIVLTWIWDSSSFRPDDSWSAGGFIEKILRDFLEYEEYSLYATRKELLKDGTFRQEVEYFLYSIQNEADISEAEVPIVIYSGPSSETPKVFELLNSQGTKLEKYDIFAAKWEDFRRQIANREIIDAIWKKYYALQNAGFDLDVINEVSSQSIIDRKYTLFEYIFGFGQHLIDLFPRLFPSIDEDKPPPAGFSLVAACLGIGVNKARVGRLPEKIHGLDIATVEEYILESTEFVDSTLKSILDLSRVEQKKTAYYHSELQIVSMIAAAFQVRYELLGESYIEQKPDWQESRKMLAKNLPMYYLFDILRNHWRGSGDSKLSTYLSEQTYSIPMEEAYWESTLSLWHLNHLAGRLHKKESITDRFDEFLLLRYIFGQKVKSDQTYRVVHIIPTGKLLSEPSEYTNKSGPINTIGNLAIVATDKYTDIGDKTFLEFWNYRSNRGTIGLENIDNLQYWENLLLCEADMLPSELTQEAFETFLRKRFELLKSEFLRVWREHIPSDPQT